MFPKLSFVVATCITVLIGCHNYEQPAYPTLSGTYVITLAETFDFEGDSLESAAGHVQGSFVCLSDSGALDQLNLPERVAFDYGSFYRGYYLSNGGDDWAYQTFYGIHTGYFHGTFGEQLFCGRGEQWNDLRIGSGKGEMSFEILEDGLEYLILAHRGVWVSEDNADQHDKIILHLERIGP